VLVFLKVKAAVLTQMGLGVLYAKSAFSVIKGNRPRPISMAGVAQNGLPTIESAPRRFWSCHIRQPVFRRLEGNRGR
jgi:hypothetical protein